MARILVAGNVGIDRVWLLDQKLRTGARIACHSRVLRLGGGAANTAAALVELGHLPAVAARIAQDAAGCDIIAALRGAGLDVGGIECFAGETRLGDIFLDPDGERTLIGSHAAPRPLPAALFTSSWSMLYVNFARLVAPESLAAFCDRPCVIAQLPLDLTERRPAHVLIASRSDIADLPADRLWQQRRAVDGDMLGCIVITEGGRGAEVVDAHGVTHHPTEIVLTCDSTGAGDFFAAGLVAGLLDHAPIGSAVQVGQAAAARFMQARPAMLRELGSG